MPAISGQTDRMKSSIAVLQTFSLVPFLRLRSRLRNACALGLGGLALVVGALAADVSGARREAERLWRSGDRGAALQRVDRALAEQPTDPGLRFFHAVLLADAGQTARAESLYRDLVRDFPELAEPYNNLAVLHAARGDLDGARALLEDALRRNPDQALAQENLGDVLLRQAERAYAAAAGVGRATAALQRKLEAVRTINNSPQPLRAAP